MSDPKHPTNSEWEMFDPAVNPPPQNGQTLLLINEGGVLITGPWNPRCFAWAYKPKIPASVKARMSERWCGHA